MKALLKNKKGVIPFLGVIVLAVVVIVLLFVFLVTLPKLIGIFTIGGAIAKAILMAQTGTLNKITLTIVLVFMIGGFLLVFLPQLQDLFGSLQNLTIIDLARG